MHKIKYLIIILLLQFSSAYCQENMGISNSNYAPTNSVLLNPSSIGDSKVYWEINLIGASMFIDNNYVYSPGFSVLNAIRNPGSVSEPLDNFKAGNKSANADIALHGPSFYLNLGKHAVGLTTQLRTVVDGRNIDANLAKFMFEGFKYLPQRGVEYNTSNTKINAMAWGEVGINYAYTFKQQSTNMYIGGISVKRLYGITHMGVNIKDATFIVPDTSDVVFSNIDAKYGFSSPSFNAGRGWGFDLGFTYKKIYEKHNKNINAHFDDDSALFTKDKEKVFITIITGSLRRGGAEIQLSEILPGLDKNKYKVEIFLLSTRGELANEMESKGISIINPWFDTKGETLNIPTRLYRYFILKIQRIKLHPQTA